MTLKDLAAIVLKSVEEAERKAKEDKNCKHSQDYINELRNFYTQNGDKGAYLNDFRQHIFKVRYEAPNPEYVKFTKDLMKRYKSGRVAMGVIAVAGFAVAPIYSILAIPSLFFGYLAIKMHFYYGKYKKEMDEAEAKEAENARLERLASETSNAEIEAVLNLHKDEIMRHL